MSQFDKLTKEQQEAATWHINVVHATLRGGNPLSEESIKEAREYFATTPEALEAVMRDYADPEYRSAREAEAASAKKEAAFISDDNKVNESKQKSFYRGEQYIPIDENNDVAFVTGGQDPADAMDAINRNPEYKAAFEKASKELGGGKTPAPVSFLGEIQAAEGKAAWAEINGNPAYKAAFDAVSTEHMTPVPALFLKHIKAREEEGLPLIQPQMMTPQIAPPIAPPVPPIAPQIAPPVATPVATPAQSLQNPTENSMNLLRGFASPDDQRRILELLKRSREKPPEDRCPEGQSPNELGMCGDLPAPRQPEGTQKPQSRGTVPDR